jgi:hypothetical protein
MPMALWTAASRIEEAKSLQAVRSGVSIDDGVVVGGVVVGVGVLPAL